MGWIKATNRLPLHKAHWNNDVFSNGIEFPVRMNRIYYMGLIYDESLKGKPPKLSIYFDGRHHFENEFSEIEWLDERDPEERTFSVKEAVEIHIDGVILGNKQGLHNAWKSHQQYFKDKFGIDI